MYASANSSVAAWLCVATLAAAGCAKSRPCGQEERCDGVDNDCDGQIDEGFRDAQGLYDQVQHCGGCGIDCLQVWPHSQQAECAVDAAAGSATCRVVACQAGYALNAAGGCTPTAAVLCLPCSTDADCAARAPGALCFEDSSGSRRCSQACGDGAACPPGFACQNAGSSGVRQCLPESGLCACQTATAGAEFGCQLSSPTGQRCDGVQRCGMQGLSACEARLDEACNGVDDDCDGAADEDFRDTQGRYIDAQHCGSCGAPCAAAGTNVDAQCVANEAGAFCQRSCSPGFVDLDGLVASGCECQTFDAEGPPRSVQGDVDCDGIVEDLREQFVYVRSTGDDSQTGSYQAPVRSPQRGLELGEASGKSVLVAGGEYVGTLRLRAGVSMFGGYAPDFLDRNLALYPTRLRSAGTAGLPVLLCEGITVPTAIEGFVLEGEAAGSAGQGSTAMYLRACSAALRLADWLILAGTGADGGQGADAEQRLVSWGWSSLRELDGSAGSDGLLSPDSGPCPTLPGGLGGRKSCPRPTSVRNVSGGNGAAASCPDVGCSVGTPCGNSGCADFTVSGVCNLSEVLRQAVSNPVAGAGRGVSGGRAGEITYSQPTNRGTCNWCENDFSLRRDGGPGGAGGGGANGSGGTACATMPSLESSSGQLIAGSSGSGGDGADGSGGGGGTAGAGFAVIDGTRAAGQECVDRSGGSGGGGGSGGCGAPGAFGGQSGGSSAGLVIELAGASTGPSLQRLRIVTASGGRGGSGGSGAGGGAAGSAGRGGDATFWCALVGGPGGPGGSGGAGGGGGGGCGGGSFGVYLHGAGGDATAYLETLQASVVVEVAGVAGSGGLGGYAPAASGGDGVGGFRATIYSAP